jgi:hypothetical protein
MTDDSPKRRITVHHNDGDPVETTLVPGEVVVMDASAVPKLNGKAYPAVGHCIYCPNPTTELTKEHIVALGLDGTAVLPRASCDDCREITSKVELSVLRGPLRAVRVLRQLRSRTKHRDAPKTASLTIERNGVTETVMLPLAEYPILIPFPIFPPPRLLSGEDGVGIGMHGIHMIRFGADPEEVGRRLGAQKISVPNHDQPVPFARMLGKIAYAYAFAEGQIAKLDGPSPILPSVLGRVDDIGRFVGTLTQPNRKYPGMLHRLSVAEDRERGLLCCEIQLFADSETPSYGVILGPLKKVRRR